MPAWEFQYSVDVDASSEFAWQFWTNIDNWRKHEPGVEFEMDGPFVAGARGRTIMPGQPPLEWMIREAHPGRYWIQEASLPGASLFISMQFEALDRRTSITQRLWLDGERAGDFVDAVRMFETTTPDGLKRIASLIERAQRESDPGQF